MRTLVSDGYGVDPQSQDYTEPSELECEDYVTCRDFWTDGIPSDLADLIVHLIVMVEPVGLNATPTTVEILDAYHSLRALKRRALEIARDTL